MAEVQKDEVVDQFETYEAYLNMFVTQDDMMYLGEEEIARLIVELGYRSSGTLSREKFFQTKAELSAARNINNKQDIASNNSSTEEEGSKDDQNEDPLLNVIKERFSANLDNSLNSLIFLSVEQENGVEISGFIDLVARIKKENFLPYLTGQKCLRPKPGDLSFANLTLKKSKLSSSEQWRVLSEDCGVCFVHNVTGTRVSSLWITRNDCCDDGSSWIEVPTENKKMKILCYDERIVDIE